MSTPCHYCEGYWDFQKLLKHHTRERHGVLQGCTHTFTSPNIRPQPSSWDGQPMEIPQSIPVCLLPQRSSMPASFSFSFSLLCHYLCCTQWPWLFPPLGVESQGDFPHSLAHGLRAGNPRFVKSDLHSWKIRTKLRWQGGKKLQGSQ